MHECFSERDFLRVWPYPKSPPLEKDMPVRYPCLVEVESVDVGIMGSERVVAISYPPFFGHNNLRWKDFVAGYKAALKHDNIRRG